MTDLTREQIAAHLYQHPGYHKPYPIQTVLRDLASQEHADGEPYDAMKFASLVIDDLVTRLADAEAAQALVVETIQDAVQKLRREAGRKADGVRFQALDDVRHLIRDLAHIDGLALVRELRDRAEKAEALRDEANEKYAAGVDKRLADQTRAESAEVERDRLAAANAVLEAKVAGLVEALGRINDKAFMNAGEFARYVRDECAALATQEAGTC